VVRLNRWQAGRRSWWCLVLTLVLLPTLAAGGAGAQETRAAPASPAWWGFVSADPIRFSSLPLSLEEAVKPPSGSWKMSLSLSYFNLWFGSWHTAIIHREFGLEGRPLEPWELRTLERRHPRDAIFRLDAEGWQAHFTAARGMGHGMGLVVDLPWTTVGAPRWDAISVDFHKLFGLRVGDRTDIARGQTLIYIRGRDRSRVVERWDDLDRAGLGDLRLTLNGPLGTWLGGSHRWAVSVEAPTGAANTLNGSGGWDLGVRWFGNWWWNRSQVRLAAGYTHLDRSGSFLGVERNDTWNAIGAWLYPVREASTLMASLEIHTSPLADFTDGQPGDPSVVFNVGWGLWLDGGHRLEMALSENITGQGTAPDFVLHIRVIATR